ncbi:hypothetical protein BEP19_09415 [Ammoniphilus oxalaticus]|uniref:ATP-grasp domain-containing protein n=1 Tax=Ammoniphilus oxalaticus TaxID=66863 RepID=A0A419SKS2_9BACL|nr:YheC/YheD family protein [Ammoniphilus oxalaticus]RKD24585.1 hypothetical protein BEP19_09415 [Ammoniphilus oxalaticus]
MGTKVQLVAKQLESHSMVIPPGLAKALGMDASTAQVRLHFGVSSQKMNIRVSSQLRQGEIHISTDSVDRLAIPLQPRYELRRNENGIYLGPFIGFLLTHPSKNVEQYLPYLNDYLPLYDQVGGAIVAFALGDVDRQTDRLRGFVYDPDKKGWESGVYGVPSSLFIKTAMLSPRDLRYFETKMGKTVFNNFNLNKWEMDQVLSQTGLKKHLPKSKLYKQVEDLQSLLKSKQPVYLKPINGSRGYAVARISKNKKGISMRFRSDQKNEKLVFKTFDDLHKFLRRSIRPKTFMIQRAVDLLVEGGRIIDFRMIMVKDERGKWEDVGLVSRFGPTNSVVSNISAGGTAELGEQTLQRLFNLSADELIEWRKRLSRIAHQVGRCLDKSGLHCGNMGVDFGIDKKGRIWILEIQHNNPDHTLALDASAFELYEQILRKHLLYLKGLAGFSARERAEDG